MPMPYEPGDLPKTASGWLSAYAYRFRRTAWLCPVIALIIAIIMAPEFRPAQRPILFLAVPICAAFPYGIAVLLSALARQLAPTE